MDQRNPTEDNQQVHFGQIIFDDMFLLLLLGVAVPFLVYTVWGLMDTGSIPPLPPTPFASAATPPTSGTDKASRGEQLAQQLGCWGCHSTDGTNKVGPSWRGLFGSAVPLNDGTTVTADENYLKESVLNPNVKLVQNYPANVMPPYAGRVSDEELDALIAYIQSLK